MHSDQARRTSTDCRDVLAHGSILKVWSLHQTRETVYKASPNTSVATASRRNPIAKPNCGE